MQRTGEIKKSVDTLWRRDGRLKVMKNIDEMLNEIGENKEIKEGGNMMTNEEKQRILTRTMEKIGRIEAESNIAAADGNIR